MKKIKEICLKCREVTIQIAKEEKWGYTSICRKCKGRLSGTKPYPHLEKST